MTASPLRAGVLLLALAAAACQAPEAQAPLARDTVSLAPPLDAPAPPCPAGELPDERGACLQPEAAVVTPGGRVFWVDQRHPLASDDGPGSRDAPWRTIGRAARPGALAPGDGVLIRAGTYREEVRPASGGAPGRRITYAAFPGDSVVVSGADPLPGPWHRDGPGWRHAWTLPLPAYAGDLGFVMRRELVVVDGTVLTPVASREALAPGTFWVEGPDVAPLALVVRLPDDRDPAGAAVEAAARTALFSPGPASGEHVECGDERQPGWIRVVGLTFQHAANRAQWGAVCAGGRNGLVEDVTVAWTNGAGFDTSGRGHVFRRNRALHNGQIGFVGSCSGCRFLHNEAAHNNWKGYDPFWEAGGGKWTRSSESTWVGHLAHHNDGPGIWLDIDNHDNAILDGTFRANQAAGIFLEYRTTGTRVEGNTVTGTRWRAWTGTGILSQAASGNVLRRNTVAGNEGGGIWLRLDPDRRAPEGGNRIEHNVVAGNASGAAGEAREIAVEDETIEGVRTNAFVGNVVGFTPATGERSSFFVRPEPGNPAHYRGSDLTRWRTLVRSDGDRLMDPSEALTRAPDGSVRSAVPGAGAPAGPR